MAVVMPERLALNAAYLLTEIVGGGPYRYLPDQARLRRPQRLREVRRLQPRAGVASFCAGAHPPLLHDRVEWLTHPTLPLRLPPATRRVRH